MAMTRDPVSPSEPSNCCQDDGQLEHSSAPLNRMWSARGIRGGCGSGSLKASDSGGGYVGGAFG